MIIWKEMKQSKQKKRLPYELLYYKNKRKKYKDKETNKTKEMNVYSIGKCKLLNDYLSRKEAIEAKKEVGL